MKRKEYFYLMLRNIIVKWWYHCHTS